MQKMLRIASSPKKGTPIATAHGQDAPKWITSTDQWHQTPTHGGIAWSYKLAKPDAPKPSKTEALRRAGSRLAQALKAAGQTTIHIQLADHAMGNEANSAHTAFIEGLGIGWYAVESFKGAASESPKAKGPLTVSIQTTLPLAARKRIVATIDAVTAARQLCATPPNIANPAFVADYCTKQAKQAGLGCKVITATQAKKLGMGGLLAVGAGGSTPPCLIEMTYTPGKKTKSNVKPVLLAGKAITFDTGGYSLKPKGGPGMKYDKCGGMNTIGVMLAIAALKPKVPVVALIACAENMIDAKAYRPDDIITFANGVTCEITNTDAEGRLVLADALAYGTKTHKPQAVIDMATLTGGVGIALGSYCAGIWCHDEKLKAKVNAAADATSERVWELPLWDEHRGLMRGHHSDLVNSAPTRECHATQGAAFLSHFVGNNAPKEMPTTPWVHIDIAYAATSEGNDAQPLYPKGPTGYGVRLVSQMLMDW